MMPNGLYMWCAVPRGGIGSYAVLVDVLFFFFNNYFNLIS